MIKVSYELRGDEGNVRYRMSLSNDSGVIYYIDTGGYSTLKECVGALEPFIKDINNMIKEGEVEL